jgi:hypothetical protein
MLSRLTSIRVFPSAQVMILGLSLLLPHAAWGQTGLPDMIFNADAADPVVVSRTFAPTECSIAEGCAVAGTRKLLQFTGEVWNIGDGDLVLGDPTTSPLFEFHSCHGHFHFEDFAAYRLIGPTGLVAAGFKFGFCLLDSFQFDPAANPAPAFDCDFQGLQAGWADVYSRGLDCQWVDVTDVPDGAYTLEVEVNPARVIVESDYTNNVVSIPVVIGDPIGPPNDQCPAALPVPAGVTAFDTTFADTDGPAHAAEGCEQGGDLGQTHQDVWFTYDAPCSGTLTVTTCEELGGGASYDSDLVVYDGTDCTALPFLACNDDDPVNACGGSTGGFHSTIQIPAVAGSSYLIRVGGWNLGDAGVGILNITNDGAACGACGNGALDPGEACDPPDAVHCDENCQWVCGDGAVQEGEECDPGLCVQCPGGQECGNDCRFIPVCGNLSIEGDEQCDRANLAGETCLSQNFKGGTLACDGTCAFDTSACTTTTPLCAPAPAVGCASGLAAHSSVLIRAKGGTRDQFHWKFNKGDATPAAEFLDPVAGAAATYRVCVYDASTLAQPLMEMGIPSMGTCDGKPCWKAIGTKGYKYKDKSATPDGITAGKLREGAAGKSQVQAKGKGSNLPTPALPLQFPVTVQMIIDDGAATGCWQTVFSTPTRNHLTLVKAKGP